MEFITTNWAVIVTALLAISEVLALIPALKGNGILDTIIKLLKSSKG